MTGRLLPTLPGRRAPTFPGTHPAVRFLLRGGGVLVFDDISHPQHPKLLEIWRRVVVAERRYSTWHFDDVGYGVAVAVRRW